MTTHNTRDGYVLVVGGAGYIGSHVNKLLNRQGYQTVVFDNLAYGHKVFVKWGSFFLGDLSDKAQIRACFGQYPISAVMHFSAYAYVGESVAAPAKYYRNNVVNTLNLLEVMREFDVRHFIFSSSCATYGIPREIPITEEHPRNPINPYGRTKMMVEEMLKDFDKSYGIKHVCMRYFNAAGADPETEVGEWHDPETHLIPLVLDVALAKKEHINIFGTDYETLDGTCIRDYVHVTDLAEAHSLALQYLLKSGNSDVFNLGNGNGFSVNEVIEKTRQITGKKINAVKSDRRMGDPVILVGSAQKAKDIIGWKPRYGDLGGIIETAWKWHQKLLKLA